MIECGKCKEWFHNICLNLHESTLNQTLLYFCKECLSRDTRKSLRIITIDYSKEHTKPLFKKHDILSIFNLYPYFCLIELYKALKFRIPYCVFELFQRIPNPSGRNLTLMIPAHIIRGGCHVPARPYVPASLDHLRVEGHDLRDAQGRTGT